MIELVDTHAHIHFSDYGLDPEKVWLAAQAKGVTRMIAVGTTLEDSQAAIEFAKNHENVWASIGIHPHEAEDFLSKKEHKSRFAELLEKVSLEASKIVAIGECGFDYYYEHSPKDKQREVFEFQLDLAKKCNLPVIFHLREAFEDFWPIYEQYKGLRGVVHSFTGNTAELDKILAYGLYIGLNGIITFTKDQNQVEMAKEVPLVKMLMETDAPFLTPRPLRGTINEPGNVRLTAEFLAQLRGESLEQLASQTTANAITLFNLR